LGFYGLAVEARRIEPARTSRRLRRNGLKRYPGFAMRREGGNSARIACFQLGKRVQVIGGIIKLFGPKRSLRHPAITPKDSTYLSESEMSAATIIVRALAVGVAGPFYGTGYYGGGGLGLVIIILLILILLGKI
jgi:hypothetical protein